MNIKWDSENYLKNFSFVGRYGEDVLNLVDTSENGMAIDLGCGNGCLTEKLVEKGYSIDSVFNSWTPLLYAAKNGQNECIEYLLDHGADINFEDDSGWSAIYNAANAQMASTVILLLSRGAIITPTDAAGFRFSSYAGPVLMSKIKEYQNSKSNLGDI